MVRKSAHIDSWLWKQYLPRLKLRVSQETLWMFGFHNSPSVAEDPMCTGLTHSLNGKPSEVASLLASLHTCAKLKDLCRGTALHDTITRKDLLPECSDALIRMYARCGALTKAEELFGTHKSMDSSTWTALIAGYAKKGQGQDALQHFDRMKQEGLSPNAATFACVLKACGLVKAAELGEMVHDEITKQGLLGANVKLGTALVSMYAKCGLLTKAKCVLEELSLRDAISWNALIAGYVEHGESQQALCCFEKMQSEGLSPDAVTFSYIFKVCGNIGNPEKGEEIHDDIAKYGWLDHDIVLGNALVDMYAKCSAFAKARQIFDQLPVRDAISWNSLIAGYVKHGQGEQALICFAEMQREGLSPDVVTFACVLKACGSIGAVDTGENIHDEIAKQGLLKHHVALGNALVDMYASSGALERAKQVLKELPVQNVNTWNVLIEGYVDYGEAEEALKCFQQMQDEGLSPDAMSFVCILKACSCIKALAKGEMIHDEIVNRGILENDIILGTALVDMYAKCGALSKARCVLEELLIRDVISWNALIAGYAEHGECEQALHCFEHMQHEGLFPDPETLASLLRACGSIGAHAKGENFHKEIVKRGFLGTDFVLGTTLVDMYAKCGALAKAWQILEVLRIRDVISWNTLIAGLVQNGKGAQALNCFEQMQDDGLSPDASTYACVLKACSSIGTADKGERIHDEIVKKGLLENSIVLGTALVDMYSKCGAPTKAAQVLEKLPVRDVITWNALIAGHVEHGKGEQALNCFKQMQAEGLSPDAVTFACVLKACGLTGAAAKGGQIHDEISQQGLLRENFVLGTVLVDMYARCGALAKAQEVFQDLPIRDVISWNVLIGGLTQQGDGVQALNCFEQMQCEGLSPNAATFSCVLSACSRSGLVEDAQMYFQKLSIQYAVKPDLELYTCMVDVFGRAGHLDKAMGMIKKMHFYDYGLWSALLVACQKWGNVEVGRWAFQHAVQVDENDASLDLMEKSVQTLACRKMREVLEP